MFTLRDYQSTQIDGARMEIANGIRRVLLQAPCGAGKTVMMADMSARAKLRGNGTLFVVHRQELVDQSAATFEAAGIPFGIIAAGYAPDYRQLIQIGSIQSVIRRLDKIPPPKVVILDECFVAGTMVDGSPIETIKVGDQVACFSDKTGQVHKSTVTHIFKNKAPDTLIEINAGEKRIVCTPSHPIYTTKGWRRASEITNGCLIYANMSEVRRADADPPGETMPAMLSAGNDRTKPPRGVGHYDGKKPDGQPRHQGEDGKDAAKDRSPSHGSGRQRRRCDGSAADPGGRDRTDLSRICVQNQDAAGQWVSGALQDRHSGPGQDDRDRGGWRIAQPAGTQGAGSQKTDVLGVLRVDSVAVHERGGAGRFTELCPDGHVYNVEVDQYSTYFANGLAVHNCHHASANTWRKLIAALPDAVVIGLTATPARLGGQSLGDIFQSMILGPSVKDLISWGNLAPFKYYAPPVAADLTGLRVQYGDFVQSEVAVRVDKSEIIGDLIAQYKKLAPGMRAVCYCVSVAHSQHTAAMFDEAGIPAAHIDGESHDTIRRAAIEDFRAGKIKVLCNVDLISEGFDVPAMEAVILARPTQSLTLHVQQSMRPMRPDKNNPDKVAVIIDHVGNVYRHGLPDEVREWTLEPSKKKKSAASEFPIKQCPKCYAAHRPAPICPVCGYKYPVAERSGPKERKGELTEVVDLERMQKRIEVGRAKNVQSLEQIAMRRGYAPGWVIKLCDAKKIPFGESEAR